MGSLKDCKVHPGRPGLDCKESLAQEVTPHYNGLDGLPICTLDQWQKGQQGNECIMPNKSTNAPAEGPGVPALRWSPSLTQVIIAPGTGPNGSNVDPPVISQTVKGMGNNAKNMPLCTGGFSGLPGMDCRMPEDYTSTLKDCKTNPGRPGFDCMEPEVAPAAE